MRKSWIFIICCILLVSLLYLYISMGYVYPKLIRVDNFNIKNVRLSPPVSFDVESSLVLKNPNPISMELKNLDFDVFINDKKATHIAQSKETKIPAMSEFSVPIAFPVTFIDNAFFSDIGSVLISGITGNKLKIKFKGTLIVKAWGFEKENEFEYTYDYAIN